MDLIRNARQLHVCWSSLSIWEKLRVVLTIKYYIQQLRRIHVPHTAMPGPLGPQPGVCHGLQFGYDPRGPFQTTKALAKHFNRELGLAEVRGLHGYAPVPRCKPLDESIFTPLVLTHNDLNMRNILLDDDGMVWVVDWGWAGFYPAWFEYLGMRFAAQKDNEPLGWQLATKLIAEPSPQMERWMATIGYVYP
jgi:Phosphotransferase enzyme family